MQKLRIFLLCGANTKKNRRKPCKASTNSGTMVLLTKNQKKTPQGQHFFFFARPLPGKLFETPKKNSAVELTMPCAKQRREKLGNQYAARSATILLLARAWLQFFMVCKLPLKAGTAWPSQKNCDQAAHHRSHESLYKIRTKETDRFLRALQCQRYNRVSQKNKPNSACFFGVLIVARTFLLAQKSVCILCP